MKKDKILLLSQSLTGGGAEKVLADLSVSLSENFDVTIVTYEKNEIEYKYCGTRITLDTAGGAYSFIKKIIIACKRIYKISKIKKSLKPIASISAVPPTHYVNVLTKTKNCKNIVEISTNPSIAFSNKISRCIIKCILKIADKVVAVSEGARRDLIENFNIAEDKISTIYNCCDIEKIRDDLNVKGLEKPYNRKYIISVGSFRYPKGHWHLIKAFSYIAKKIPDIDLIILGDGDYRKQYNELINNLDIDPKRIVMPGFVPSPHFYIKNSELFVFTSLYEGFGNVIIEAMACGTPVLSADCDYGPYEILNSISKENICKFQEREYGWMYPAFSKIDINTSNCIEESEKKLGDAILTCLNSTEKRNEYRIKGQKRCYDFDINVFKREWESYLASLEDKN